MIIAAAISWDHLQSWFRSFFSFPYPLYLLILWHKFQVLYPTNAFLPRRCCRACFCEDSSNISRIADVFFRDGRFIRSRMRLKTSHLCLSWAIWQDFWWISENIFQFIFFFVGLAETFLTSDYPQNFTDLILAIKSRQTNNAKVNQNSS